MFYYRYRPYNEVSIKELLYNEIYFSSPEECNDPFDSKTFYEFGGNKEMWNKVIKFSIERTNATIPDQLLHLLAEYICKKCPLTFDEAHGADLLDGFPTNQPNDKALINFTGKRIQDLFGIYKPATRYFVSFSKVNPNSPRLQRGLLRIAFSTLLYYIYIFTHVRRSIFYT